jgi:predicted metalloprotease with PDZ domain
MYTTSHELMHWYIPTAFAFDAESPPSWFAEGFTDYMAMKILLVGDLIEPVEFLEAIGQRLASYRANPLYGNTSILRAQDDFWNEDAYRYIYDGGAAAAFLLDLGFQDRGGSLERALRELQKQDPVTIEKVTAALASVRENSWIHDWLDAGTNPDWEARFSQYGLAVRDGRLTSLNDWTTDALSSIRP